MESANPNTALSRSNILYQENMKNKEKPEILIPKGYCLDEMLDFEGDLWDEKPEFTEEVKIHFE